MNKSVALCYDDRGQGHPVVFLHGHPFDRSMWSPQLDGLSRDFRTIAVDLPGYGRSPVRSDPMTMRALADAVVSSLDRFGIDRAVFVGLSMGGLVAMELGLNHPTRTRGLVLAATTAAPVTDAERLSRAEKASTAEAEGMLPLAADMVTQLFGPRASRDSALVLRLFAMMLASPPEGAAAALRGRAQRPDYTSLLPTLAVPALVIAGAHDRFSTRDVIDQLVAALPDPQLITLRESGHLPNLEEPEAFNRAVRRFVNDLVASDRV